MESTLEKPALVVAETTAKSRSAHLGFPDYFRVELSWAKLLGVLLLLASVPARVREWAYAGFAITLTSAVVAHLSVGDGPEVWSWAVATSGAVGLSYFFWHRLQATPVRGELARRALSEPRG